MQAESATLRERIVERTALIDQKQVLVQAEMANWNAKHEQEYRVALRQALDMKDKYVNVVEAIK
jgi:hypothetical protein